MNLNTCTRISLDVQMNRKKQKCKWIVNIFVIAYSAIFKIVKVYLDAQQTNIEHLLRTYLFYRRCILKRHSLPPQMNHGVTKLDKTKRVNRNNREYSNTIDETKQAGQFYYAYSLLPGTKTRESSFAKSLSAYDKRSIKTKWERAKEY